ncbi:MAG: UvrB/UvrC motif-containing protein [Synergistaceae bacterium]|jgi:protein arginine kinase activator|nr:UvrB/UvrC motif-containing protein [Synergistaceae bacterium]
MICDNCGKNEVEVLLKQVINNEVRYLNLCRACAEEMGFIPSVIPSITISFSISEDAPKQRKLRRIQPKKREAVDLLSCPSCGMKFISFRENGLLGCPACYEAFRFPLGAFLQKTQGAESHWVGTSGMFRDIRLLSEEITGEVGAAEKGESDENITRLKFELNEAVAREDYERAAQLRDALVPLVGGKGKIHG